MIGILDSAKWAPSGDNGQGWFITLLSDREFLLDLSRFKVNAYNLLPMPDWVSTGMFLENAAIAAQQQGKDLTWRVEEDGRTVRATLVDATPGAKAALFPFITTRSVNRFPYRRTRLSATIKREAEALLDDDIRLYWLEGMSAQRAVAAILRKTTDIRLRIPETYTIHRDMVEWEDRDSADRMPAGSLGMNRLSLAMMRWALATARRNRTLLSLPGSTLSFQLELDTVPAVMCAAHFMMGFDRSKTPAPTTADYLRAGASMQRFWLYLTSQGIALQPWYIPLMFSRYVQDGIGFTTDQRMQKKAVSLHRQFTRALLTPQDLELNQLFFTGRIGYPKKQPPHRSVRKPVAELVVEDRR